MAQAVNNETFFNATLYVSSVHDAGLRGKRGTSESLYYKAQTIKLLNKSLRDSEAAVSDETLAAVLLLTHVVSLIGEPNEAEIHMNGLRQMMVLRGGIQHYTLDGVFLHMLRIRNHRITNHHPSFRNALQTLHQIFVFLLPNQFSTP
ncbi:uncharacterized protein LY89DRAFT_305626 [Mollisia scopiformis]|uniref:Uncharacterized protein n=1 Tax=Mollisia scopiformis TaxID=149040 RepID=A0A194XR27_MOLSC|nr:uncharacterized protein LY89DRAFT_305626 [Mollisia scopiformis]KUJ22606.1 hypothetical protein LY89DRAFT_305626 [Mollisia scopiformis]